MPHHPDFSPGPLDLITVPLAYVGGAALLVFSVPRAVLWPRGPAPRLLPSFLRELDALLVLGLVLVGLVHVPLGSFLAMQAFYNATFTEAVGAVVGLGLLRNMAPMATGLTLAGILAARITPQLRGRAPGQLDDEPGSVPDRDTLHEAAAGPGHEVEPARLAAPRLLAALLAGPVLALWGTVVGTVVGMLIAQSMLNVSYPIFLGKILEMLRPIDVAGLVVKGSAFTLLSAVLACHEGLKPGRDAAAIRVAVFRATGLGMTGTLAINSCWFTVAYLSGDPFGPAVASL
jgi:phospholipid/cholesterol/gamma-HCH transport system permease protein